MTSSAPLTEVRLPGNNLTVPGARSRLLPNWMSPSGARTTPPCSIFDAMNARLPNTDSGVSGKDSPLRSIAKCRSASKTACPLIQSIPGIEGRTRSRHRIELGRSQLQIAVGYQAPRRIAILWIVASETQVALAAQRYLLETWSLIADSLCVDPIDHPVATE